MEPTSGSRTQFEKTVSEILASGFECTGNSGTVTLSPGLTDTAAVQTMRIKGTLTGCAGDPFTEARYTATLKTAGPVSCSVLKDSGRTSNRGREIQVDTESEESLNRNAEYARDGNAGHRILGRSDDRPLLAADAHRDRDGELYRRSDMRRKSRQKSRESSQEGYLHRISGQLRIGRHQTAGRWPVRYGHGPPLIALALSGRASAPRTSALRLRSGLP